MISISLDMFFFFFNDTATTEIYTLSLHDALPICRRGQRTLYSGRPAAGNHSRGARRSEEHTSELQSLTNLVCRLLLEKKKKKANVGVDLNRPHICHPNTQETQPISHPPSPDYISC